MDHAELKAYIEADPTFADYIAGGNDQDIAVAISARTVPVIGAVSRAKFAMWAGVTGLRASIQTHADAVDSPLRSIALTLLDFLQGGVSDELHLDDPANQAMLDAWIQAGALTQTQADDLMALATADQPVFGSVSNLDVATAFGRG
jgi:hypothetical protein